MEKIKIKGIDEVIYYTVTKSGMPVYIWKNEHAKSFNLSLNVKYGSIHTEFMVGSKKYRVPNGIAHFMEHIKFNVDKDRTANDLFDALGSDINAFTTFKYTSYLVSGVNNLLVNLNNLLDYVLNPYFTKEMIKKERGIIISEINMVKDQPYNNLYFLFNKCIYNKEKYRNLIAGEVEDVKKIDLDDIKLIYDAFYHPKNMFLVATGNVNPYEIEAAINDNLDKKDIPKYLNPVIIEVKEPKNVCKSLMEVKALVEVPKAKVGLKIEKKHFKNIDDIKLNIILNLILSSNFGDTSDLKEELLSEGLVTYLGTQRYVMNDYVVIDITIESKYIDEAIKRIVDSLNNLSMDIDSVKRKINSAIAALVMNYENSDNVNNMIQSYIIYYGKVIDNIKEVYEDITIEEVEEVMKGIDTKEMTIVKMVKDN